MDWGSRRMMTKVATLYYFNGWTQAKIAKKYGVSRPVISKVLQRAKDEGIVEIYIRDESIHTIELEQQLEQKYDLQEAIVVSSEDLSDEMIRKSIGKAAASYISNNLEDNMKLGISWGNTIASVVEEFPYLVKESLLIVPLVGGMGRNSVEIHANQLAYKLANKLKGDCTYLYAPAIVESKELKERLIQSTDISSVLEEGRNVDMAIVGIGNPYKNSTMKEIGYVTEDDIEKLKQSGIIGDINSQFFDKTGEQPNTLLNERVIGIDLEDLKQIPKVIAVVNGEHKVSCTKVALEKQYINVLITDYQTAKQILLS